MLYKLLSVVALFILPFTAFAQAFDFELDVVFNNADEANAAIDDFSEVAKWILQSEYKPEDSDWQEAGAYVIQWLNSTDSIEVYFSNPMLSFSTRNESLLVVFAAAWGLYALEHPSENQNPKACCLGAVNRLMEYVEANKLSIARTRELGRLKRRYVNDELDDWVEEVFPTREPVGRR